MTVRLKEKKNFALCQVNGTLPDTETTKIQLRTGEAADAPAGPNWCVVYDASAGGNNPVGTLKREVILYQTVDLINDELETLTRVAQGSGSPIDFDDPDATYAVWFPWTEGDWNELDGFIDALMSGLGSGGAFNVTVAPYNADNTGATDSTTGINAAITAAIAADGYVYFPPGTYQYDTGAFPDGSVVHLRGPEMGTATLKKKASTTTDMFTVAGTGDRVEVRARQLTFDYNKANVTEWEAALFQLRTTKSVFEKCRFIGWRHAALRFDHVEEYVRIKDCEFLDPAEHGGTSGQEANAILFTAQENATDLPRIEVLDSYFNADDPTGAGAGPAGVSVNFTDTNRGGSLRVEGCEFVGFGMEHAGNSAACIHVYKNVDDVTIKSCRMSGIVGDGVRIQKANRALIEDIHIVSEGNIPSNTCVGIQYQGRSADDGTTENYHVTIRNCHVAPACTTLRYACEVLGEIGKPLHNVTVEGNSFDGQRGLFRAKYITGNLRIVDNAFWNQSIGGATGDDALLRVCYIDTIDSNLALHLERNHFKGCQKRAFFFAHGGTDEVDVYLHDNRVEDCAKNASMASTGLLTCRNVSYLSVRGNRFNFTGSQATKGLDLQNATDMLAIPMLGICDLAEFGALSPGLSDQTASVQEAFTAAAGINGEVKVPVGTCTVNKITGTGVRIVRGVSKRTSILAQKALGQDILYFSDSEGCLIERIKFQGIVSTTSASSNAGINYTSATASGGTGIGNCSDLTVRDCWFKNLRYCGVIVEFCEGVHLHRNFVDTCNFGLLCYYVRNCHVSHNRLNETQLATELAVGISINHGNAVAVPPLQHNEKVTIEYNTFDAWAKGQPILIHDCVGGAVSGNILKEVLHGIHLFGASAVAFQDVHMVTVSGNSISHRIAAPDIGWEEQNSYGILVTGNESSDPSYGIVVDGNTIYGANIGAAEENEGGICLNNLTAGCVISNNNITYCGGAGICVSGTHTDLTLEGNKIRNIITVSSKRHGISFPDSVSNITGMIAANRIGDCAVGVYIHGSATVTGLRILPNDINEATVTTAVTAVNAHCYTPIMVSGITGAQPGAYVGTGVPASGLGANGSMYSRLDSPYGVYQKQGGSWVAV